MLMTIKSIELRNFMAHRDEKVKFPSQGIVLLWGPSGAGKSSLLDAIGFALFGHTATRAGSLDELRHELYPEEDFGVRVSFDVGERKTVQIFRGVERGKTAVWMVDPDGNMTEGPRAVAGKVKDLMGGMDASTFFATYFSQQGELDALVRMPGGNRRKFVQNMMGVTLLDKVSTRINKELLRATERITMLDEAMPSQSKQELLDIQETARTALAAASDAEQALVSELEAVKVRGVGLAQQLEQAERTAQEHSKLTPLLATLSDTTIPTLTDQIAELRARHSEATAAVTRVADSAQESQELADLQALAGRLAQSEGALVALQRLRSEQRDAEQALADAQAQLAAIQVPDAPDGDLAELEQRVRHAHSAQQVAHSQATQLQADLERLAHDQECFTCHRPLDDPQAIVDDLSARIAQAGEQAAAAAADAETATRQLDERRALEKIRDEATVARQRAQDAVARARQHAEQLAANANEAAQNAQGADAAKLQEVRAKLEAAAQRAAALEADRQLAAAADQRLTKLNDTQAKLNAAMAQRDETRARLDALDHDPDRLERLRSQTNEARSEYMRMRDELAATRETIQVRTRELADAEANAQRYDQIIADRATASERHGTLQRLQQSMKDFKGFMIGQIRPTLETKASEHLSNLTEGRMSAMAIDDDYNLSIKNPAGYRRIGLCSGGEQARAAFSLRLAMTQLVSKRTDTPVGFLVFDEIMGSQDENHRRQILEAIRYARAWYPQTFLISHEDTLRESDLIDLVVDVPDSESVGRIQVRGR